MLPLHFSSGYGRLNQTAKQVLDSSFDPHFKIFSCKCTVYLCKCCNSVINGTQLGLFSAISSRSMMKFESGYTVETVFDGSKHGIEPYSVEVSPSGELLVLDSMNSNVYEISAPLSRCKLIYGAKFVFLFLIEPCLFLLIWCISNSHHEKLLFSGSFNFLGHSIFS